MLTPEAAILLAAPVKGVVLLTGAALPVGAAVPTGATGTVLLTKVGGGTMTADALGAGATETELTATTDGAGVTVAMLVATSTGVEETTGATTGVELTGTAEVETTGATTGVLTTGAAAGVELVTGLVKVQGQLVIVKVVASVTT